MNTKEKFTRIYNNFLNFFFPKNLKCIFCAKDIPDFEKQCYCDECAKASFFNNSKSRCKVCDQPIKTGGEVCHSCKDKKKNFERSFCPFIYEGPVRSAILKFKTKNAKYLAPSLSLLISERLKEENAEFDVLIPVPLSEKSLKKRGYNQALLLANELGKIFDKPVYNDVLLKVKETKNQKRLSFLNRQKNLKGAFVIKNSKLIKGKRVMLVDDILTTCATADICCEKLTKHADWAFVCSFARNLLKQDKE